MITACRLWVLHSDYKCTTDKLLAVIIYFGITRRPASVMHYAFAFSIILVHFCSVTYGYTNTSLHENFRLISRAGIRDHNEGGIFYDISVVECGRLCIIDKKCLSFEFDVSRTCYISHTNQYEEPESFLVYDNSDYYEWHGISLNVSGK